MLRVHLYLFLLYDLYYYSPVPVRGAVVHTTYGKKSSIYRFPFNVHMHSFIIAITSILMTSISNTTPIYICMLAKLIYFLNQLWSKQTTKTRFFKLPLIVSENKVYMKKGNTSFCHEMDKASRAELLLFKLNLYNWSLYLFNKRRSSLWILNITNLECITLYYEEYFRVFFSTSI